MRLTTAGPGTGGLTRLLPLLAISMLVVSACAAETTTDPDPTPLTADSTNTTGSSNDATLEPGGLDSYDSIQDLAEGLNGTQFVCALEYEGLDDGDRIISLCVIDGEQALLTIWADPVVLADFVNTGAGDTVAFGDGWTVEVDTGGLASLIADALGGAVPGDADG